MTEQHRHPATEHLLSLFEYEHLPEGPLRDTSMLCATLARTLTMRDGGLGDGPELSTGLRKLVEAKDCFVRQAVVDAR